MSRLGSLSSPDVARAGRVLAVPVGATEQHGPHLPLGTDTVIAQGLADGLAARRAAVTVAPALAYGSSGEHQDFPGTLSIGREATETLLVELVRSATETFSRVLLVNAHGGNAVPVRAAVDRLRAEGRDVRAFSPAAVWRGDAHAGHLETSVMLALAPSLVDRERAVAGNRAPLGELLGALVDGGVAAVSPSGVLGDPTGASAAVGAALIDDAVTALVALVDGWDAAP